MKVTVVDYGRSNLLSVRRALEYCGGQVEFAQNPTEIKQASALVLPGVGAFADGMAMLKHTGLDQAIVQQAGQGVPLLGICLGM
uniref:imidazole glycerol phosphate synthase subunit HisH n=1 Tax=uncultured Ruthenibacterium sp. TaxID=1905347 RepID=UPI00349E69F2